MQVWEGYDSLISNKAFISYQIEDSANNAVILVKTALRKENIVICSGWRSGKACYPKAFRRVITCHQALVRAQADVTEGLQKALQSVPYYSGLDLDRLS